MQLKRFSIFICVLFFANIVGNTSSASLPLVTNKSTFINGELRADTSQLYNAGDYKVQIWSGIESLPSGNHASDFTTSWLGVYLNNAPGPGGGDFSQVGLKVTKDGIQWFVYAEPGVECLIEGTDPGDGTHCYGDYGHWVSSGIWHTVELVKYSTDNYWIARIYDTDGVSRDVAKIWSTSSRIYVAQASIEEGYFENQDPFLLLSYWLKHPQYKLGSNWQDWPLSEGTETNFLKVTDSDTGQSFPSYCPSEYGATPNYLGDPYYWFGGTRDGDIGTWCRVEPLFPVSTTYFPDTRAINGINDWLTHHQIQNLSSESSAVQLAFFDASSGGYLDSVILSPSSHTAPSIPGQGRETLWPTANLSNYEGGALLTASTDVAVVAENHNVNLQTATNYTGILPTGEGANPGWGRAAKTLYTPTVKRNYYGNTTDLHIMNVGSADTTVTIRYYNDSGNQVGSPQTFTLPRNASKIKTPASGSLLAAKISATQPLAGIAFERPSSGNPTVVGTYNLLGGKARTLYSPVVKKNYYNHSTGIRVHNTGSGGTNITAYFYEDGTSNVYTSGPHYVLRRGSYTFWQDPNLPATFLGSVRIYSSNRDIVSHLQEAGTAPKLSTSVFQQGSTTSYIPEVCNNCGGWYGGISIQNVGSSSTNVTVKFYNSSGSQVGSTQTYNVGAKKSQILYSQIPSGGPYTAVLSANQPIIATVNMVQFDENKDLSMSYNAPNR